MASYCRFCKTPGQKTAQCANCGTVLYCGNHEFIYGRIRKESAMAEVNLTDKYLIIRAFTAKDTLGDGLAGGFGVLGVLTASAIDSDKKKIYAYYDLRDLQKVVFPYRTNDLKKDTAFWFVDRDGRDFILNYNDFGAAKGTKKILEALMKVGLPIENGDGIVHPVCCANPLVDKDTFGRRVARSAATFVHMSDKQFVAPAASASAPVQPTAPVAPMQPAAPYVPVQTEPPVAPQTPQLMCAACGTMNIGTAKFCVRCGASLSAPQKSESPAAGWLDKWK